MKVEIKQWVPVATWSWPNLDSADDLCGICRAPFEATCPTCSIPGFECPPITGECSHSFHHHCIVKWLNIDKTQKTCPMCRQPFVCDKLPEAELQSTSGLEQSMLEEDSVEIDFDE